MGKYRAAVADSDTHAHADSNSIDLADSVRVAVTDSHVQRDTVAYVATADPSDFCVPDTLTSILSLRERMCVQRVARIYSHHACICSVEMVSGYAGVLDIEQGTARSTR